MSNIKKAAGNVTRSRTALAFVAATMLVGGSVTEASAKSRHHRHHHHHHHQARAEGSSWRDANASVQSSGGHTFSGMASFYGNESGSRTASGQRFNQMITNRVLGTVLLGVNEQINCDDCISAFGSAGSFSAGDRKSVV